MDVSILIVNYNTRELTLECIRSVYEQTKALSFEVILVDNASTDGSADAIAEDYPEVQLIRLERNIGFAAANNVGARSACGKYILLLNPDTVILDNAVYTLAAFAAGHPSAGLFGGRTISGDGA